MLIKYFTKIVYGCRVNYIVDKEQAKDWEYLSKKKTITDREMMILGCWGIKFESVPEGAEYIAPAF